MTFYNILIVPTFPILKLKLYDFLIFRRSSSASASAFDNLSIMATSIAPPKFKSSIECYISFFPCAGSQPGLGDNVIKSSVFNSV